MTIALVAIGILVLFWVYRYITDKQYGQTKRLREIEKLERERKLYTSRLPRNLKDDADRYYQEKQKALFNHQPGSRLDAILDRTKQVISTFRRKEK